MTRDDNAQDDLQRGIVDANEHFGARSVDTNDHAFSFAILSEDA
jgi:hypothetical protein